MENKDQKLIVGLLYIDNYDEALTVLMKLDVSFTVLVDRKINKYMQGIDAVSKKLKG